jgi:AraC family transcriptional regulator
MPNYYNTITEENKVTLNKPANSDMVYYSELNEWFTANAFRSFSLKYVINKCIYYKVGNKEHTVTPRHFMLACKQPDVKAYFDCKNIVQSICIDICPATVADAFTIVSAKDELNFDNYQAKYFTYPEFFEAVYPADNAALGRKLEVLSESIKKGTAGELIGKEWFFDLVEKIIYHEYGNYLALNGLNSVKLETRKELLRRLSAGKIFIDENFLTISEISEISGISNLSEFHFFRSFKQAYHTTPYQYLLNKRLEHAKELINKNDHSITEISLHCNFPDLFTFSKAFKKRFGVSPSQLRDIYAH